MQRIALTGILNGKGKPQGWANRTYFYPDSTISTAEFENGLKAFDPRYQVTNADSARTLTVARAFELLSTFCQQSGMESEQGLTLKSKSRIDEKYWKDDLGLARYDLNRFISRAELAVLTDRFTTVFDRDVDLYGRPRWH